jgi:ABC-2 type transport system permease protein
VSAAARPAAAAGGLAPAGRHPQALVATQVGARAVRSGVTWGLAFAGYLAVQILAYTSAYPTLAARDQLTRAYGGSIGLNALLGDARAINTVAGYAAWRVLGALSILGAIWGVLTATRLLRGDEDAGRYELLLAGQTTRRRAGAQALAGLGAGLGALFVLTAVAATITGRAPSVGFTAGQSLYFAVTLVAAAATFLAVGALASQLASTRRRASGLAGAAFGACYALRMVADSDAGLHWLTWLTPLGWIEEARPLAGPRPLALVPVALLILPMTAVTVRLAGTRDLGSATWPGRDTARPHLALTGSPTGLAARLMRPAALGWLLAIAAFAALLGTVAQSSTKDATADTSVRAAISRLGGHGSAVAAYLGLTFLVIALMVALIAAGQAAAIRAEEADGHLENLIVRPVRRTAWLAGRLLLSAALLTAASVLAGVFAWAGVGPRGGVGLASLTAAGVNVVPPGVFLLGLGALTLGVWPRPTSLVVYGYLTWSFLIELTGAVVHASHWLMDTSVFFHMMPAPAAGPDWASAAVIAGLGISLAVIGAFAFRRRDVTAD